MPETLRYNEAMGSPEAHLAVLKTRVDSAQADYDAAVEKNIPAQVESTSKILEAAKRDYDEFSVGGTSQEGSPDKKPETIQ